MPQAKAIGLLLNPNNAQTGRIIGSTQQAANAKGLQLEILKAGTEPEVDAAFATAVDRHIGAVIVGDPLFDSRSKEVVTPAAQHGVPAIYSWRKYVSDGGLISYGAISTAAFHAVGSTPEGYSTAPSPPTCRSNSRPISSWLSISTPPRRLA